MNPLDTLCLILLKGTLLLGLLFVSERLAHRQSAARRHLLWFAGFAALLILPSTGLMEAQWSLLPPVVEHPSAGNPSLEIPTTRRLNAPTTLADKPEAAAGSGGGSMSEALVLLWLAGVFGVLAATLPDHARLWALRRRSLRCSDQRILTLADEAATELRYSGSCSLLTLPTESKVPLAWGFLRPVIALPVEAAVWSDQWLRAALRHELGHVVRRDPWWRLLARVVCAVFWINPLVWIAARRWRLVQEQACDDLALRGSEEPVVYAEQLIEIARELAAEPHPAREPAVAMARSTSLAERLRAVMDTSRDRRAAPPGLHAAGLVVAAVAVVGLGMTGLRAEPTSPSGPASDAAPPTIGAKAGPASELLDTLRIGPLTFEDTPMDEVVNRLSAAIDSTRPAHPVTVSLTAPEDAKLPRLSLQIENVRLSTALSAVSLITGATCEVEGAAIRFDLAKQKSEGPVFSGRVVAFEDKDGMFSISADETTFPNPANAAPPGNLSSPPPQARISLRFVSLPGNITPPQDLDDLAQIKGADVLSSPSIVTAHRKQAEATVGRDFTFTDTDGSQKTETLGVSTMIVPDIQADGITLDLEATVRSFDGSFEDRRGKFPVVTSRSLKTRVHLPEGGKRWVTLGGHGSPDQPGGQLFVQVSAEVVPPQAGSPTTPSAGPAPGR